MSRIAIVLSMILIVVGVAALVAGAYFSYEIAEELAGVRTILERTAPTFPDK